MIFGFEKRFVFPATLGFPLILLLLLLLLFSFSLSGCVSATSREELAREYYNLGNAYFEIGEFKKAIGYYEKAYNYDSSLKSTSYNLALSYIKTNDLEAAIGTLKNLLEGDPENLKVLEALAYAYHLDGNDESAVTILDRILEISPENTDALNNKGIILWDSKDYAGAEENFRKILKYDPEDTDTKFNLGKLLIEAGQIEEGLSFLEDYAQARPDDWEVFMLLGHTYEKLEMYEKSLEAFNLATSIKKDTAEAWFESAKILLTKVEDPDKGLVHLKEALNLGFKDLDKLRGLLKSEDLMEKDKVKELLEEKGIRIKE